jgi:hypothetical protein
MGPSIGRIAAVALPTAVLALLLNMLTRAAAIGPGGVPAEALPLAGLIAASVMPVLGPSLGYYMAFRNPGPNSMRKFLLPGAALVTMGILIEVGRFVAQHHHVRALLVGGTQGIVATALILPLLLWLVPHEAVAPRLAAGDPAS